MQILLDTHAYLWWLDGGDILSREACDQVSDPQNQVFVSTVSIWEIIIKQSKGKLACEGCPEDFIEPCGFLLLDISLSHMAALRQLPAHHSDPFDRLLIAQATCENLCLMTRDRKIASYYVRCLAC
jgi:PIN domain nuclease of toxin-antitoxin system